MRRTRSQEEWDPEAFADFYRRHERAMVTFLMRRTGRPEVAADLTSEVFAAALIAWRDGRERPLNERAWLYGVAQNRAADQAKAPGGICGGGVRRDAS